VILGTSDPASSTAWSRHVSRVWVYNDGSGAQFRAALEAYLRAERPAYVLPLGETPLRRMLLAPERFVTHALWVMPDPDTIRLCFDKRLLYRITFELGIPTPRWHGYAHADVWRRQARQMGFPVVIKRKDSALPVRDRKALIFRTAEAFEALLETVPYDPDPGSLILQKFAPGERHNCHFAAAGGKILAFFQQKVLRTDELDGAGIGVEGISVPPSMGLRRHCERLLARLRYDGIGCIQFLVDERSAAFLELNPRMDSTAALPYRLGHDFPLLAMRIAMRHAPEAAPAPERYACGRRYHWLYGDFVHWQECVRGGRIRPGEAARWAFAMLRLSLAAQHLTWDWADPLPTLHMYWKRFSHPFASRLSDAPRAKSRPLRKQG
jgi:hypothetical protein